MGRIRALAPWRGLGHDQVLYGSAWDPTYYTTILDFSDGVAPPERLFQKVEMN
ncbi:hypothetical protein [Corallococcus exercitus]|uniref:Uncharacterized protein n=1 Tax=Corallococcus exercitus TaxID=2316736 RepID=A0A7Y4KLF2_9BACT|nr:hypothetical protein [Corallococcus exercitus]NOK35973.1 hypothetical protein [Corallococcus exercitus]